MSKSEEVAQDSARAEAARAARRKLRHHGATLALCAVVACSRSDRTAGSEAPIVAGEEDDDAQSAEDRTRDGDHEPSAKQGRDPESKADESGRSRADADRPGRSDPAAFDSSCVRDRLGTLLRGREMPNIVIDGATDDWEDVAAITIAGRESEGERLRITADCDNLYVLAEADKLPVELELLIDADGDPASGLPFELNDKWSGSGIDHGFLWDFHVAGDTGGWQPPVVVGDVRSYGSTRAVEYKYAVKAHEGTLPPRFGLAFRMIERIDGAPPIVSQIPSRGMWRLPPAHEGRGMIIPAYLTPQTRGGWDMLAKARDAMRALPSALVDDFWVVISGPDNGAPSAGSPFSEWHKVQQHGAKLFGYVHSCKNPPPDAGAEAHLCEHLLDRSEVEREVARWKSSVDAWNRQNPEQTFTLSGIWVDEFYPRFEGSEPDAGYAPAVPVKGKQRDPRGRFFDELVKTIRATDATWQVIGNAGGPLPSDQLRYAELLDVVCSFEADISQIEYVPHTDEDAGRPGITLQTLRPKYGQLALVHGNVSRMEEVVERAFKAGYSHVYTTSLTHSVPVGDGGTALNNVWGDVPSYLVEEAKVVKDALDGGVATRGDATGRQTSD